ncbi:pheST operon leader peptide PheM [Yersinia ruckeri]|nr:pheST operon leader peptide PheM [Yersinia ruckeri]UIM92560.1 pheST operon leader peptide PheM [Yersinia ruckeri]UIM95907.1 pheST operon leader peptide PheM [Yersinia ruckeri]UIM99163.1 pheST operon leader peptide PheM [Yersinia ruckeri]UIN02442.1 pheST operon leader peptide PheM [Yersinia ruckeri]
MQPVIFRFFFYFST